LVLEGSGKREIVFALRRKEVSSKFTETKLGSTQKILDILQI
jgi:hypothetical protein